MPGGYAILVNIPFFTLANVKQSCRTKGSQCEWKCKTITAKKLGLSYFRLIYVKELLRTE